MKFVVITVVLFIAAVYAAKEKKEEARPKTFRRLIPADVLRGMFRNLSEKSLSVYVKYIKKKIINISF